MSIRRTFAITLLAALGPSTATAQAVAPETSDPSPSVMRLGVGATGVIEKIFVRDGDHVEAGKVLLSLDCHPLEAEIKVRTNRLAELQAAFERTRNGPRPQEIAIGEANLVGARARAEQTRQALERATALRQGVSTTLAIVEQLQGTARVAAAELEDAKKTLDLLRAGSRVENIREAQARRDTAEALVAESNARLNQCSVRAPAAGKVKLLATVGQLVSTMAPVTVALITPTK